MLGARVKPAFGPTLPELLHSRALRLPRGFRGAVAVVIAAVVLIVVVALARGGASTFTHSGAGVSFSFSYRSLVREPAPPGEYVRLAAHDGDILAAELEVGPLRLPPYPPGDASGIEPVAAASEIRTLAAQVPGFALQSEAPTVVGGTDGFNFTYTRPIDGRTYYGRVIFLTPPGGGAAVRISLLAEPVLAGIIGRGPAALAGALFEPGQGGVGVLFQPSGLLARPLATFRLSSG